MATAAKMLGKKGGDKAATKKASEKKAEVSTPDLIKETSTLCEKLTKVKALNLARKLSDDIEFNYFKLGGVMSVMQANGFWDDSVGPDDEKYDSFKVFMETEYGMPYRKGMYLIQIYNNLVESGVSWDDVKDIGWTKLKEISGFITPENVDEWRERALSMTTIQLIEYIKALDASGGENKEQALDDSSKSTTITFKVHEDQKQTIQDAVTKSMKENKTEFQSVGIEYICMGYLEGKVGKIKKVEKPLIDVIKNTDIEELFGVIEAVFPQYDIMVTEK